MCTHSLGSWSYLPLLFQSWMSAFTQWETLMCSQPQAGSWLHPVWIYLCLTWSMALLEFLALAGFFFSGHFLLDAAYLRQGWQVAMNCSMSLFMPGQYIVCFASSMHLVIPRCPVCSSFRNRSLITFGMMILWISEVVHFPLLILLWMSSRVVFLLGLLWFALAILLSQCALTVTAHHLGCF